ncbi:unnamed protein product [Lupinus luteus]|uniref:Retrovirus-related Pol polyprotein from transposon TNT 1-94 n=1 Tax=Lupinus luteus TaxID=3873 RepID=A0AAV1VVY5_LUPLU
MCARQAAWMSTLMEEIGLKEEGEEVLMMVDNKSAINLALNPVAHGRSKHIETRFHYLRDQVEKRKIKLEFCSTDLQQADLFTKALKRDRFVKLRWMIGMRSFAAEAEIREEC